MGRGANKKPGRLGASPSAPRLSQVPERPVAFRTRLTAWLALSGCWFAVTRVQFCPCSSSSRAPLVVRAGYHHTAFNHQAMATLSVPSEVKEQSPFSCQRAGHPPLGPDRATARFSVHERTGRKCSPKTATPSLVSAERALSGLVGAGADAWCPCVVVTASVLQLFTCPATSLSDRGPIEKGDFPFVKRRGHL